MAIRIHVIDHDSRRRASIAREFLGRGYHAEIYEDLTEFKDRMPSGGYVFAHDDAEHCDPRQLREMMGEQDIPLPMTFYSADPAPERIVQAMQLGAWDYLKWPFDSRLIDSSLHTLAALGDRVQLSGLPVRRRDQAGVRGFLRPAHAGLRPKSAPPAVPGPPRAAGADARLRFREHEPDAVLPPRLIARRAPGTGIEGAYGRFLSSAR